MKWSRNHDTIFVREILLQTPWMFRKSSPERGEVWAKISISLNAVESPQFHVSQRAVRDRYLLLEKKHKKKVSEEEKASGISPEESEVDKAMADIITQFDEADATNERLSEDKKKKIEVEAAKAEEMRRVSMETFKESQKRNSEFGEQTKIKRRASGSDTMSYLKEKAEKEIQLKFEEIELRKTVHTQEREFKEEELKVRKLEVKERKEQHSMMSHQVSQAQILQQKQMEQLYQVTNQMMQQQQQQSAAFMAMLERLSNK